MKYSMVIVVGWLFLVLPNTKAQVSSRSELGLGLGAFTYTGDMSPTYEFSNARPAGFVLYRLNINTALSFRASLAAGMLEAFDRTRTNDVLPTQRAAHFNVSLIEVSAGIEYHFLNWLDTKRKMRLSPYLFVGAALFGIANEVAKSAEYSNIQMAIPFGGGIKYIISPKIYLGLEMVMRKTFFDYLDNVSNSDPLNKSYQQGNEYDNDNYFLLGLSVNYVFYTIPCFGIPYK